MPLSHLQTSFERRARALLANHPHVRHEWRDVKDQAWGDRRDLVCALGEPNEVFVSLASSQLTVGLTRGEHSDFEDFGRGLSDEAIVREAFQRFADLLRQTGHLDPEQPGTSVTL